MRRAFLYTECMTKQDPRMEIEKVLTALRPLRLTQAEDEIALQNRIETALLASGVSFIREAPLTRGSRIDFLTAGGVGIEVKRGRPARTQLLSQLERYAASERVAALVLVSERLPSLPDRIGGKPCLRVGLHGNWGVAL